MLQKLWIQVRSSLWFVPALLVLAAVIVAVGLVQLDIAYAGLLAGRRWEPLLNAGAEGARGMLTAIAGSMITVAGVAFSITIVTLSLASTQYTPRILRNFMRDRANQFVLGTFVAIFTYCLIVMRTIRGGAEENGGGFVPLMAVAFGMLLALVSIGCLIFFIHHVATSIQASTILKAIANETEGAIDALHPDELGNGAEPDAAERSWPPNISWQPVRAQRSGYLQHGDAEGLLRFAKKHNAIVRLERSPGDFVAAGTPLVSLSSGIDEDATAALRNLFVIGAFRTIDQDAGFGVRQIVDIAMKALSPGVNDTSTAVTCIDYLSVVLAKLANRRLDAPFAIRGGEQRVLARPPSFQKLVAKSFDEVRLSADGNVTIILQMLCALRRVRSVTRDAARRRALLEHVHVIVDAADRTISAVYDRARINNDLDEVRQVFELGAGELAPLRRRPSSPQNSVAPNCS